MQLILRVVGCPAGVSLVSRAFGLGGGTIGRNPDCTLALPDPHRYISRVHAEIRHNDGDFLLKVLSKVNPVVVNGSPVGFNQMVVLKAGDRIDLGDYHFFAEVSEGEPARQSGSGMSDPFAMFDGLLQSKNTGGDDLNLNQDPFFQESQLDSGPNTVWGGIEPVSGADLADLLSQTQGGDDPLLSIMQSADARKSAKPGMGPAGNQHPRPTTADESAVDQFLGGGRTPRGDGSGLGTTSPMDSTLPGAGGLGERGDHVHDINLPFSPPGRKGKVEKAPPAPLPGQVPGTPVAGQMDDAFFADLLGGPSSPSPAPTAAPPSGASPEDVFSVLDGLIETPKKPQASVAVKPQITPVSVTSDLVGMSGAADMAAARSAGQSGTALIAKFAEGLNMPGLRVPPAEAEQFMLDLGQMFRIAVEGVHTLLLLRSEVKKELRAEDRTMIASRENNPLKHTETVEEALNYLLDCGASNAAFLPPARAMEDAFRDMRAHELAVMAGMRAGLAGVLKRFDPKALEPRIKKAGALDAMVPALYKAKLWDTYMEFYKDIESEAEDHFDKLFGREFVRAYMEQTKQLKKTKKT